MIPFGSQFFSLLRPETETGNPRVCSVKNHKTSFFLGDIFWERFVGQPLGVHMMCSFLISSRWFRVSLARFEHKQTDGLATLTPLFSRYFIHMFQVFYPHFPDILSTCSRYFINIFQVFCHKFHIFSRYAPAHPYRCHPRMLRGLQP